MLKIIKINSRVIVAIVGLFFCGQLVQAEEIIHNYNIDILINKDASIDIVEKIKYDFGTYSRHGIYRIIPVKYLTASNNWRKIRISDVNVILDGEKVKYKKSKQGRNLKIKIGSASKTISGQHEYQIKYKVKGAINYFEEHDELYWNVIGGEWEVPIQQSLATISAPEITKTACFQGMYGSLEECVITATNTNATFKFKTLQPEEMGTIVVGIKSGVLDKKSIWQGLLWFMIDNWVLFLPVVALFWGGRRWWKYGRDPKGRGTIIPYYKVPDNLSVAEISVIMHNGLRSKDISAMIIQLAVKGFIKIEQKDIRKKIFKHTNYIFHKSIAYKNKNNKLTNSENKLFKDLFEFGTSEEVSTDNLKDKFYNKTSGLEKQVITTVKNKGYLPTKTKYDGVALVIVGIVQMILLAVGSSLLGRMSVVVGVINLAILVFFAVFMGHRTKKGVLAKEKLLGLKLYLETAEKDRLKFHNAPSKNPQQFEKLLPYAMVFDVEEEWAEQFKDIYNQEPDWYQGAGGQAFNTGLLANNLNSFSKTTSSSVTSSPSSASSGGSGFSGGGSGGGFGGGGGGSW